jgi:hypothetical protein
MSGLTKKTVFADRLLSALLDVREGELVSYAQLSKGLHKYIKDNGLKNRSVLSPANPPSPPSAETVAAPVAQPAQALAPPTQPIPPAMKKCKDCGVDIPAEAIFCDLCGVQQ